MCADGTDAYAHVKKMGRFRMIKRTEGVSSTDIVGRMLMCTRVNPRISEVFAPPQRFMHCWTSNFVRSPKLR